jgi:hypothetical protein
MRNPEICNYCVNQSKEVCVPCEKEGKYRYLEVEDLTYNELPPELPPMRELVDRPAQERLAIIWMSARYTQRDREKGSM